MLDVAVVGAGLFGSVVAAALRREGREVTVFDDLRAQSGSKPAACLMRPSWLAKLGKDVYLPSLSFLDDLYGLQDIRFRTAVKAVTVHWCDPQKILKGADREIRVERVWGDPPRLLLENGEELCAKRVVIAAGFWSNFLAPVEGELRGLAGLACLWPKERILPPFIRVWAPYRQLTAFNRGDGLWAGDSNAVRIENWQSEHTEATEKRCQEAVKLTSKPTRLFGVRPYSTEKGPCYLREASKHIWVVTGGAKNGVAVAGWCASELLKRI